MIDGRLWLEGIDRIGSEALLVMGSLTLTRDRKLITEMAARLRIPAVQDDGAGKCALIACNVIEGELDHRAAAFLCGQDSSRRQCRQPAH